MVLVSGVLGGRFANVGPWGSVMCAVFVAVIGIVVLPRSLPVLALAVGLMIGAGPRLVSPASGESFVGIDERPLAVIRGRLRDDLVPEATGIVDLELTWACGSRGDCARARGVALLPAHRTSPDVTVPAGAMVEVFGTLDHGRDGSLWINVISDRITVLDVPTSGQWRLAILATVAQRLRRLPPDVAALAMALLTGRRDGVAGAFSDSVRRCGCAHVLALSGMHLAILSVTVLLVIQPLLGRRFARFVLTPCVALYVWIVGPIPSLLRAAVALVTGIALSEAGLRLSWHDSVFFGVVIVALFVPEILGELAFAYSAVALGGMALLSPSIHRFTVACLPPGITAALSGAVAAFTATAPVSLAVFGVAFPIGVLAATPLALTVTVFMWLSITVAAVSGIPLVGTLVHRLTFGMYSIMQAISNRCAGTPALYWKDPRAAIVATTGVVAVAVVVLWWRAREESWRNRFESQLRGGDSHLS